MALQTADGRDVSNDEWRPIPDFSKYKINSSGDVLGPNGLLKETYNSHSDTYAYAMKRDNGKRTARSFRSLLKEVWPELYGPKKLKVEPTSRRIRSGEWRSIPSFPKHEIHQTGEIRYKAGKRRVWPIVDLVTSAKYYRLTNEWGEILWSQAWLLGRTFPELILEQEAA